MKVQQLTKEPTRADRWNIALGILLLVATAAAQDAPVLNSRKENLSYALGMEVANNLLKQSVEIDPTALIQGFKDTVLRGKPLLTVEEARSILGELQQELKRKQAAWEAKRALALNELAEKSKKDGEAFLAANKTKEGVVALGSGLQYKVLKAGGGNKPGPNDEVVCHYRGTLIDGTEFDSSYKRNKPATLPLAKLIQGWKEGLQLMPVGSKWNLYVPSDLAYGERGMSAGGVGPNATLIFEVELISIKDKPKD